MSENETFAQELPTLGEMLATEVELEAATTRAVLERLRQEHWSWRPHARSRTVGELVAHIAALPGLFLAPLALDGFDRHGYTDRPTSPAEALACFDRNVAAGASTLRAMPDAAWLAPWRYAYGDRVVFELPRLVVARSTGINHLVHHRGQLSVYLRLLEIPLPPLYGPTADG